MKNSKAFLCALTAFTIAPLSAHSQNLVSLSIGYYDVIKDDGAVDFRAEYRPDIPILSNSLKPWAGIEFTSEASVWGGGGLLYDHSFSPGWYVTPSFGAGLYVQGGSNKDLGFPIQFRPQIEITYEFETGQRAGIAFSHLSNLSLDDSNPGTEVLSLYWHMPY